MILECPTCNARFLVPDSMVPAHGRTVRCGACTNQWFVSPAQPAKPEETDAPPVFNVDEIPDPHDFVPSEGSNVPVIQPPRKFPVRPFKIAVPVLAIAWLVLAFITYFPKWQDAPVLSGIYGMVGAHPTDGLLFDDVHMEREEGEIKTKFILSGSIVNHAAEERMVPTVHVALKDKNGKAVWGRDYPVNTTLAAGEVYPFRITNIETSFADTVTSIVVDLGHSLQLMMR